MLPLASAIPSFFRGPKCNRRLAHRCGDSRMTSPEGRVRGSELRRKRSRHAQCGTLGLSLVPYEGEKASNLGRSRNEGIPEGIHALVMAEIACDRISLSCIDQFKSKIQRRKVSRGNFS